MFLTKGSEVESVARYIRRDRGGSTAPRLRLMNQLINPCLLNGIKRNPEASMKDSHAHEYE